MTGMSSWTLLAQILRPWPYRLLFFGLAIVALSVFTYRFNDKYSVPLIAAKRFGAALLGGQFLAAAATILFFGWNIGWRIHPDPVIVEDWVGAFWHFYVDDFFSKVGLGLAVLGLVLAGGVTWKSIGIRRPSLSIPSVLVIVAVAYLVLHFLVAPVSLNLWEWCLRFFGADLSQGNDGIDPLQWEVWSLRQVASQIGILGPALIVLCIGILAPVFEEMFFRGMLFTALLERLPTWGALIGQALLFAVIHLDLVRLPYLIVLGLVLGYLVKRTSSLLPAVLLHIIINVLSLIAVMT